MVNPHKLSVGDVIICNNHAEMVEKTMRLAKYNVEVCPVSACVLKVVTDCKTHF